MGKRLSIFGALLFIGMAFSGLSEASTYNLRRLPLHWDARRPKVNSYGDMVYARANDANYGDIYLYRTMSADPGPFLISRGQDCFRSNDVSDIPIFNFDISDSGQLVFGCRSAPGGPARVKIYDIPSMAYSTLEVSMEDQLKISRDGTRIFFYSAGHYVAMTNGGQVEQINVPKGSASMNRAGQVVSVHQNNGPELHGPDGAVRAFPEGLYWSNALPGIDNAGNVYIDQTIGTESYPAGLYRWSPGATQPIRLTIGGATPSVFVEGNPVLYQLATEILDGLNSPENHVIGQGDSLEGLLVQNAYIQSVNESGAVTLLVYRESPALPAIFYSGPVMPDFKVLLNGKEYLFDDCAPFNDPCKSFKGSHKAGEFLRGDTVKLEAQAVIASDTCEWSYGPVGAQPTTLAQNCSVKPEVVLPTSGPEDFEVTLKMNGLTTRSKLLKVRERIEIAFAPGKATTPERPYPTFWQLDYSNGNNQWHKNGGNGQLLKDGGCAVTSLAMLARIKIPASKWEPPEVNQYLAEKPHEAFDGVHNVHWYKAARALEALSLDAPHFTKADPRSFSPDRATLEHLARKRKLMVVWTHSRTHTDQDDPAGEKFKNAKWLSTKKNDPCNPASANTAKCHAQHNHYLVVSGLGYLDGERRVLVKDPGYKATPTVSLDHSRTRNEGYDRQVYGVASFTPEGAPRPLTLGSVETVLLDSSEEALLETPSGKRLGTDPETHQEYRDVGVFGGGGIARDGDDEGGDALSTSVGFSVPEVETGIYTIRTRFDGGGNAQGSAVVEMGGVTIRKFFQETGTPGAVAILHFSVTGQGVTSRNLSVTGMRLVRRTLEQPDELELRGTISDLSSLSPGSEEIGLRIGFDGASLGSLSRIGGAWMYYAPERAAGIYDFRLKDDGGFVVKARNFIKDPYRAGDKAEIALTIGDDEFSTRATIMGSIPRPFVEIRPERLKYAVGEKARVKVEVKLKSQNPEVENVAVLKKNGEEQFGEEGTYQFTLKAPGTVALEAQLFAQNKRAAKGLQESLKSYRAERDQIRNRLEDGVTRI